jgi:hypothetical protein
VGGTYADDGGVLGCGNLKGSDESGDGVLM